MSEQADLYICKTLINRKSTYSWMLVLMISSQLLLTGFISYWLVSQYRQERKRLAEACQREMLHAYDRQVDTLLMKHLIAPTLNDSIMLRVDLSQIHTAGVASDSTRMTGLPAPSEHDSLEASQVFAFRMDDSTGMKEERLVRSVRLFINETDEAFRNNTSAHAFSLKVDPSLLKETLQEQLMERGWDFTLTWQPDSLQAGEKRKNKGLLLSIPEPDESKALQVRRIGPYLMGQLWPEFLFALMLLSLSCAALIITYRNLKKQVTLNELRNDFISNISHELKTPVATVKVALEALQKFDQKKDPKVTAEYLDMASREAARLEGLVGKVLQQQNLEHHGSTIQLEPCDLRQLLDISLKSMEISIREHQAQLILPDQDTPCMVMADPIYLEGVLMNLIDNSLKYAGPRPEIEIGIACTGNTKKLYVRDKGPGIPDEYKHQIFHKFFRIPAGNRHDVKGYGLGLHFASRVMDQLGGRISFRNISGGGCEFVLEFPT